MSNEPWGRAEGACTTVGLGATTVGAQCLECMNKSGHGLVSTEPCASSSPLLPQSNNWQDMAKTRCGYNTTVSAALRWWRTRHISSTGYPVLGRLAASHCCHHPVCPQVEQAMATTGVNALWKEMNKTLGSVSGGGWAVRAPACHGAASVLRLAAPPRLGYS